MIRRMTKLERERIFLRVYEIKEEMIDKTRYQDAADLRDIIMLAKRAAFPRRKAKARS